MSPWLWLLAAVLVLPFAGHLVSLWLAEVGPYARFAWSFVGPAASRGVSALGSRVGSVLLGAVLCLVVMNGAKWLPGLVKLEWPTWVPSVVVPVEPISGPRQIYIIREQTTDTPQFSVLANQLRNGDWASKLKAKGHSLEILDDDAETPAVKANAPYSQPYTLLVIDPASNKVTLREVCPDTADGVLAAIAKGGG